MTDNTTAAPRRPGERTRQEKAVAWAVHHAPELAIVATPLAAGWLWSAWLDLGSLLLAGLWAANEIRLRHRTRPARQAAVTTAAPPPQLTTTTADAAPVETAGTDRKEAQA